MNSPRLQELEDDFKAIGGTFEDYSKRSIIPRMFNGPWINYENVVNVDNVDNVFNILARSSHEGFKV